MIYCLPVYFETYVCTRKEENIVKYIFEINFRFDKYYIFLYKNIYDNLATVLIPLLSLAWLNNKIYKLMKIRTLQIKELLERKKSNKEEEGLFQVLNVFRIYYQYIIHVTDTDCVHQSFDRNVQYFFGRIYTKELFFSYFIFKKMEYISIQPIILYIAHKYILFSISDKEEIRTARSKNSEIIPIRNAEFVERKQVQTLYAVVILFCFGHFFRIGLNLYALIGLEKGPSYDKETCRLTLSSYAIVMIDSNIF